MELDIPHAHRSSHTNYKQKKNDGMKYSTPFLISFLFIWLHRWSNDGRIAKDHYHNFVSVCEKNSYQKYSDPFCCISFRYFVASLSVDWIEKWDSRVRIIIAAVIVIAHYYCSYHLSRNCSLWIWSEWAQCSDELTVTHTHTYTNTGHIYRIILEALATSFAFIRHLCVRLKHISRHTINSHVFIFSIFSIFSLLLRDNKNEIIFLAIENTNDATDEDETSCFSTAI